MDEEEHRRYTDLYDKANIPFQQNKYDEALKILNDSGLQLFLNNPLGDMKIDCLVNLGKAEEAQAFLHEVSDACAKVLIADPTFQVHLSRKDYKAAITMIDSIGLRIDLFPSLRNIDSILRLLETRNLCEQKLQDLELASKTMNMVNQFIMHNDYQQAQKCIRDSNLPLEEHDDLDAKFIECLHILDNHDEAYEHANALRNRNPEYKMTFLLNRVLGDKLTRDGKVEEALSFYNGLIQDSNTSNTDIKRYRYLINGMEEERGLSRIGKQQAGGVT